MHIFGRKKKAAADLWGADSDVRAGLLPEANAVRIDGIDYELNTDWSIWAEIDSLLSGRDGKDEMRLARALTLAYPVLPHSIIGAVRGMLMFLSCGDETDALGGGTACRARVCDLRQDFEYIWSAFISEFGIDLTETKMHWRRFRALLSSLSSDCRYSQIVMYRSVDLSQIKDAERRKFYAEMKRKYRLRDTRSDEEREADCAAELGKVF